MVGQAVADGLAQFLVFECVFPTRHGIGKAFWHESDEKNDQSCQLLRDAPSKARRDSQIALFEGFPST